MLLFDGMVLKNSYDTYITIDSVSGDYVHITTKRFEEEQKNMVSKPRLIKHLKENKFEIIKK